MFERCVYFNSNTLARKLNAKWEKAFAQFSLPPSYCYLLRLILAKPGLTQKEIAAELNIDKSTATRFIAKLEEQDFLTREPTEKDLRERKVFPSKKAEAIRQDLESVGGDLYQTMCEKFGKKEVDNFVVLLRKVSDEL